MTEYKIGMAIGQIVRLHKIPIQKQQQEIKPKKEIFTTKLIITMAVIEIVKIAVLILWPT